MKRGIEHSEKAEKVLNAEIVKSDIFCSQTFSVITSFVFVEEKKKKEKN